ncbi:MAG: hypothetical protein WC657_04565 [Candidatus Paceibacterota bacterium]|jgi:hypothetical protein
MKTNEVYNIKYVDASYSYAKKIDKTELSLHEAYGYVNKSDNNIIITFIKKKLPKGQEESALGLVIPDTALLSYKDDNAKILADFKIGMSVAVTWRDIVIFESSNLRKDCSTMYTEGFLFKIEKDHIVLKNPETIRTYPTPIKNHPINKPSYCTIPVSFIISITIIK